MRSRFFLNRSTRHGIIIRVPVTGISVIGRITQGVKVMNLDEGDSIMGVARVVKEDKGGAEEPTGDEAEPAGA